MMIYGYTVVPDDFYNCEKIPKDWNKGKDYNTCLNNPKQYLDDFHNGNIIILQFLILPTAIPLTYRAYTRYREEKSKEMLNDKR